MNNKKILLICLAIALFAVVILFLIFNTEPTATSEGATRQTAMLVDVVEADQGNYQPRLVATGTVQPVEDVLLSAQVGGQVVRRDPSFTPGGFVQKGAVLLQIDPSDFRNTLELRQSELMQSRTNLEMEMGRQEVAEQDLELAGVDSLSSQERALVLRQPQLGAVRATVKAAEAAVDQGKLLLSRTTIRAPFNAHILSQNVTVGSQVAPGDDLGRLVGSENYRVILTVPVGELQWLNFTRSGEEKGSEAMIRNRSAWGEESFRVGYLDMQVGALDDQTRLARVLVNVPDPLAREEQHEGKPELMIGAFVEVELLGKEIHDAVRISRDYIRSNQTVWVMEDEKLSVRDVKIILTDRDYAYIREGLRGGEKVVTTNLSTVSEGAPLRTGNSETPPGVVEENADSQVPE